MSYTKNLFKTVGLLRKFNFSDIPQKTNALSNILSKAYSGGNFLYDDINVVTGIKGYGTNQVRFYAQREYDRLAEIEIQNTEKIQVNEEYPNAEPMQTIQNQLTDIKMDLGEGLLTGGGNGLKVEYFNWPKVYGDARDIKSVEGGSYVEGQTSSIPQGETRTNYFSPNTVVAPSDSESFFEFNARDLAGAQRAAIETDFNNGYFNFGTNAPHPTIINNVDDACVIKLSGYYNSGFQTYGEAGTNNTGKFERHTDRFFIVAKSASANDQAEGAETTFPCIVKLWDVDQRTGFRIRSDDSPTTIVHFAPGINSPVPTLVVGVGQNSPVYMFGKEGGRGINDTFFSPQTPSKIEVTNMDSVGYANLIVPISDGSPAAFRKFAATSGGPAFEIKRNKYSNPFKQNTFYAIEMYFMLPPRIAGSITRRSIFFQGYHHYHGRPHILKTSQFWSDNPLQKKKGKLNLILEQSIKSYGTKISDKASRVGSTDGIIDFGKHTQSMGNSPTDEYGRLLTESAIQVNYVPPRKWSHISRLRWRAQNFGRQVNSPHQFHYVAFGAHRSEGGSGNSEPIRTGNLLIDVDSPKPRAFPDCPGSVLDSFTYIEHMPYNHLEKYVFLSKAATGVKTKLADTTLQAIDHRGLKGYGTGQIKLIDNMGVGGASGIQLLCGQLNPTGYGDGSAPYSRLFYDGEPLKKNDIIIFEDYEDSPFLQVFDTSPGGAFLYRVGSNGTNLGRDSMLNLNSDLNASTLIANPYRLQPSNNTPEGKNFFVYHHKGLVDESLDGFCSIFKTGTPTIQALVKREAEVGATNIVIDRNSIESYDGQLYRNPWLAFSTDNQGGIFGMAGDYNGTSNPNGTIINKVVDLQLPDEITISGSTSYDGVYQLDQFPKNWNYANASPNLVHIIGQSAVGAPQSGDQYWKKKGDSPMRIHWHRSGSTWKLVDVAAIGGSAAPVAASGGSYNSTTGKFAPPTSGQTIDGGTLSYTDKNSPDAGLRIALVDSSTYAPQGIIQTLKVGFGITICDSPGRAKFRYQCFPPTDTAPPFRATATGLRTLPAGENGDGSDGIGSVEVSYASPNATNVANTPVSSISFSQLRIEGAYGDNSPGDSQAKTLTDADLHTDGTFFQPGGVVLLDAGREDYNTLIDFNFITPQGETAKYQIIATTDPTKSAP